MLANIAMKSVNSGRGVDSQTDEDYAVLVPVQKRKLLKSLLPPAIRAAKECNGKIILLNVVERPIKVKDATAKRIASYRKALLSKGRKMINVAGCECEITVKIARSSASVIKRIAEERQVKMVMMGGRERTSSLFKSEIHHKLLRLNIPIIICKDQVKGDLESVVVFIDDLQHAYSMMLHAPFLLSDKNPKMYIVHTFSERADLNRLKSHIDDLKKDRPEFPAQIILKQVPSDISRKISTVDKQNTCILFSYSGRKWFKDLFSAGEMSRTDFPVFLFKP
jgi:nucleotide-binding universal stress UspA family protein